MSDRFDPEAWPYPDDDESANKPTAAKKDDDQDDYQSLDFDNPTGKSPQQGYGDPYSDAPYSDVGYDDFGYTAPNAAAGQNGFDYDEPSAGFGGKVNADDQESPYGYEGGGRHAGGTNDLGADDDFTTGQEADYLYGEEGDNYAGNHSSGDYDDEYSDDDYDDNYDDDDYDDREPKNGGSLARKLLGAGAVVAIVAAAIFVIFQLVGGGGGGDNTATPTTAAPTTAATSDSTATTAAPANGEQTATVAQAPAAVTDALNNALTAWGRFAVSGDLTAVQPFFAAQGTQYEKFKAESDALKSSPPGGSPLSMTISNPVTAKVDDDNWIVDGNIKVARAGDQDQNFKWEFRLVNNDGTWQISTVRTIS